MRWHVTRVKPSKININYVIGNRTPCTPPSQNHDSFVARHEIINILPKVTKVTKIFFYPCIKIVVPIYKASEHYWPLFAYDDTILIVVNVTYWHRLNRKINWWSRTIDLQCHHKGLINMHITAHINACEDVYRCKLTTYTNHQ